MLLVGARQTGKTTLVKYLQAEVDRVDGGQAMFLTLELPNHYETVKQLEFTTDW